MKKKYKKMSKLLKNSNKKITKKHKNSIIKSSSSSTENKQIVTGSPKLFISICLLLMTD